MNEPDRAVEREPTLLSDRQSVAASLDDDEVAIRVRYAETDRMGLLHHANYIIYFEQARTELLRRKGLSYREMEDAGSLLVIVDVGCEFKRPAYYDDVLRIKTIVERVTHVKIVHRYEVRRDDTLIAKGRSTLACVDREGRPQPLPPGLRLPTRRGEGSSEEGR